MTAIGDNFWSSVQGSGGADAIKVREAHWGFVLSNPVGRSHAAEKFLKLLGLGLFPCVGAMVAFSGLTALSEGAIAKLITVTTFSLIGVALFVYASRGLRRALQVDTAHGVFRLGTENTNGSFTETGKFPFKSVESIFLMRGSGTAAKLHLRLKSASEPVFILSGPERVLVPVLERTTESVRRSKGSRKARTKTTGRYMHVSFS